MKKSLLIFSIFSIFILLSLTKSSSNEIKNKIVGIWKTEQNDFLYKFTINNKCYSYHKDSTFEKGIDGEYVIKDNFIQMIWHPLEQTHLKVLSMTDSTLTARKFFHRPTRKEIIVGSSKKIRLKLKRRRINYVKKEN